ncbi:hypothetical protein Cni_G28565 [Canna indica]|uniref:Uncharacterized protein n=1 Tax=Canna indica TaxID=4628 RepID=A0AAQ3L6S4_9LILI|nr:hypothetical protein Cni_G28565 [Canna indica]
MNRLQATQPANPMIWILESRGIGMPLMSCLSIRDPLWLMQYSCLANSVDNGMPPWLVFRFEDLFEPMDSAILMVILNVTFTFLWC